MATLQATIRLYDRFSAELRQVNQTLERTIQLSDKLQRQLAKPLKVSVQTSGAHQEINGVMQRMGRLRQSRFALQVRLNVPEEDINRLRKQIQKRLEEPFKVKVKAIGDMQPSSSVKSGSASPGSGGVGAKASVQAPGIAALVSSALAISFGAAVPMFKQSLGQAINQQEMMTRYSVAAGSDAGGKVLYDAVSKQALAANVNPAEAQQSALSFLKVTTDPAQVTALNRMAMRMQKLNPSSSLKDTTGAMSLMMNGDSTALLKGLGISQKQLKESGADKAVASGNMEGFMRAMDGLLAKQGMSDAGFDKLTSTPASKMAGIQQQAQVKLGEAGMPALEALVPVMDKIMAAFESGKLDPFFNALSTGLYIMAELLAGAADAALFLLNLFLAHGQTVADILSVLAMVLLPLLAVWLWSLVAPILAMAAAFFMANWPLLLIIAIVGLLLFALLQMGVSAGEIIGFIVGLFLGLGAEIYNVVATVWNLFASFADFLVNLFIDPIYAVQKLFYDLAMMFGNALYEMLLMTESFAGGFMQIILEGINGVIGLVNGLGAGMAKLFGKKYTGIATLNVNNPHALSDSLKQMLDGIEEPTSDKDIYEAKRMDVLDSSKIAQNGQDKTVAWFNSLSQKTKKEKDPDEDPYQGKDKWKGGGGMADKQNSMMGGAGAGAAPGGTIPNIGKVNEVGSIGSEVDIGSEELKVMRDLAEMKAIQNFVTLTPTVQVTTGPIHKQVDVDDVVRKIAASMEQEIESSAGGVYARI
ncbi:hypothetical protein HGI30_17060 [Paenibacillus albicereus]|uniref:Phage tail tape measure protein n=1 Tax=Paenibacillus albicereus TaxID=2726185 RepID=A0A6H2H0C9_9BACL|nr:hypothetical protein [Paenibacillus albicereus]QJC53115.1 hypothetical protein HGI30_17060 [Paenibacillus albicereus]